MDILDLDELKWYDDKTFGGARAATSDDGKFNCLVISVLPDSVLKVFPQKSFAALSWQKSFPP